MSHPVRNTDFSKSKESASNRCEIPSKYNFVRRSIMQIVLLTLFAIGGYFYASNSVASTIKGAAQESISQKILDHGGATTSLITEDDGKIAIIPVERLPKPLQAMLDTGDKVVKALKGPAGLTAWVILPQTQPTRAAILYTLDEGTYLLNGALLGDGASGVIDLSQRLEDQYRPVIDHDSLWSEVEKATWIPDGANNEGAKFTMYGFFDANCIYCHLSWLSLKPYLDAGLQVRWLPVAVIGQDSGNKAAMLLAAKDQRAAMKYGHENWDTSRDTAFPAADTISPEVSKILQENNDLLRKIGASGTPAFMYKDKSGKVNMISGLIRARAIPGITGMPYIKNDNPKLKDFQ